MKNILVIGATSAIAEHCARIWASEGHSLFLVGRNAERLQSITDDLRVRGASQVFSYTLDLGDIKQHELILNNANNAIGVINTVLIAHGTLPSQEECQINTDLALREINTNALSVVNLMGLIANRFEVNRNGTIAVISSVAGDRGRASNYVYGSAKAMVTAFASGLRQRLHKNNVAVVLIKPGLVDTPMTENFEKGLLWAKPDKVALSIVSAINKKKNEVYVPSFWWLIMAIIKQIPNFIFNKINL